ncbi:FkbM family methyltransferase [Helicobacter aurati]|uniref:FkbM family methyltransferase n=1 Tax=Helicobacter aurati TaxID=137778 RepID=A0A3D8J082_9HELI|nr:FkbM family methyltransferase [Helicobacter aurati]RDU70620.1 FkbM family methyltransferase [Helicobacter aurati]
MILYPQRDNDEAKRFCQDFLEYPKRRYLFGINDYALSVFEALHYDIVGFVCDKPQSDINGIPVITPHEVPKDSLIVSCVVLSQALTVASKLDSFGLRNLDYFAFATYSKLAIKPVEFVSCDKAGRPFCLEDSKRDIQECFSSYLEIYNQLEDADSKAAYQKCVNFRYSSDIAYMQGFTYTPDKQYFEDFIPFHAIDIFVDIGAYHGETTLMFLQHNNHASIHCFEPENANFLCLQRNLKDCSLASLYKMGIGKQKGQFHISTTNGSANRIINNTQSCESVEQIEVIALDSMQDSLLHGYYKNNQQSNAYQHNTTGGGGNLLCL